MALAVLRQWIQKATFDSGTDLAAGGLLSPDQTTEFLKVLVDAATLTPLCRQETSKATKFEVPRLSFNSRILKKGVEATRLVDADRVEPATGLMSLNTSLFKGEVLVSDEAMEDSVEGASLEDSIAQGVAEAVGRDVEDLAIKNNLSRTGGDTGAGTEVDVFYGLGAQWFGDNDADTTQTLATKHNIFPTAQRIADASTYTSFTSLFGDMYEKLPSKYKRDPSAMRFLTSMKLYDRYATSLAARGTVLGDKALIDGTGLSFRGVPIVGIPMLTGTETIASGTMTFDNTAVLIDPKNIVFGFHRRVRLERFRDPRDGATSVLVSVRFDCDHADPSSGVSAKKISGL